MSREHVLVAMEDMPAAAAAAVAGALIGLDPLISLRESLVYDTLTPIPLHTGAANALNPLPINQ